VRRRGLGQRSVRRRGASVALITIRSGAAESDGTNVGLGEPSETTKKIRHIANLLENAGAPYSESLAAAWIAPFNDDPDPSYAVEQWLDAGWRDPWLVAAAVSIFAELENAMAAMRYLGADAGSRYTLELVRGLLEAHEELQRES
jgi:hypothetical protein